MTNNAIKTLRQLRLLRGLQNQDTVIAMPNFMVSKENVQMHVRVLLVAKKAGPWLGLVLQVRILIIIFFNLIWYALHTAHVMRWYIHPRHLTEFPYLELRSISVPHRREKCEQWLKCPLLILFSLLRLRLNEKIFPPKRKYFATSRFLSWRPSRKISSFLCFTTKQGLGHAVLRGSHDS